MYVSFGQSANLSKFSALIEKQRVGSACLLRSSLYKSENIGYLKNTTFLTLLPKC